MAILTTVQPVNLPGGVRMTTGFIDFNGTTYSAGGLAVTAAQWGAGTNGIDAGRNPDFVLFTAGSAADDADSDGAMVMRYIKSTGKVSIYGSEPLVDEVGLGEDDAAADLSTAFFLAFWITGDPAGKVTA